MPYNGDEGGAMKQTLMAFATFILILAVHYDIRAQTVSMQIGGSQWYAGWD